MRDIVFALLGAASGYKAITRARIDIARLRATGQTFGEAHFTNIAVATPLVVAINAILYFLLARHFDHDFTVLSYGVLVGAGMWLSLIDVDTHLLPRRIVNRTLAVAMPLLVLSAFFDDEGSVIGMFVGAIAMWCILRVLEVLSRGDLGEAMLVLVACLVCTLAGSRVKQSLSDLLPPFSLAASGHWCW